MPLAVPAANAPRRGAVFYAFDLLWAVAGDVRALPLTARKAILREIAAYRTDHTVAGSYVRGGDEALLTEVWRCDLEGIIGKPLEAPYAAVRGRSPRVKVLNPAYSQARGGAEMFNQRRQAPRGRCLTRNELRSAPEVQLVCGRQARPWNGTVNQSKGYSMTSDSPVGYEDRACAFLDILGFKELIERSGADQSIFDKIRTALDELERTRLEWDDWSIKFNGEPIPQTLRSQTFSDSILVSDADRGGLFSLLKAVAEICVLLFDAGILTRGGIAKGKLYHTRSAAFGKAFVDAYLLESRVAKSPRILVTDAVRAAAPLEFIEVKDGGSFRVSEFLAADGDGLTYFDWLRLVLSFPSLFPIRAAASREKVRVMLESGKRRVVRDLSSASDYDVLSKLGWFVRYFNASVARFDYASDLVVKPIPVSYVNLPLPEWDGGAKKA